MTTTIGLLTTGKCEHRSLPASLQQVFANQNVLFESVGQSPIASFTSCYLTHPAPATPFPTLVENIVEAMAAEFDKRDAPDFVFVIDDLELPNMATAANVTSLVRDASKKALGATPTHRQIERFQKRCSFHLLAPMVEAYFYGESDALKRAGAQKPALISDEHDLEHFLSGDAAYLAAPTDERGLDGRAENLAHPKRYLQFLAHPEEYKETRGGCDALSKLDWTQVFERPPPAIAFARSLFDDLADALGVVTPFPGTSSPLTSLKVAGVLRNL